MDVIHVSKKCRISIPKEIREKVGVSPGSTLSVEEKDGAVILRLAPPQAKETKPKTNGKEKESKEKK